MDQTIKKIITKNIVVWGSVLLGVILLLSVGLIIYIQLAPRQVSQTTKQPKIRMIQLPQYPKTITVIDDYDKTSKNVPIEDFSRFDQMVPLNNGKEVDAVWKADAVVWIYKEEIMPQDKEGTIVPLEKAVRITIKQYGKDNELLRERTMDISSSGKIAPPKNPTEKK